MKASEITSDLEVAEASLGLSFTSRTPLRLEGCVLHYKASSPLNPGGLCSFDLADKSISFTPTVAAQTTLSDEPLPSTFEPTYTYEEVSLGLAPSPECTLLLPNGITNPPLVVTPHGGPHSVSPCSWSAVNAWMCARGWAVLAVNYRGSVGYGREYLDALPGNIGEMDVADCVTALDAIKGKYDPSCVAVCGGSHGGFLSAHLVGQHPLRFKAGVMRNPVTDVAAMYAVTDIPDWCIYEATGDYDFATYKFADKDALMKMHDCSPMRHIDNVEARVLLCLGSKDLRVPVSQGLNYYHALKGAGKDATCKIYPEDCHPLSEVGTEFDHWCAVGEFLEESLKK